MTAKQDFVAQRERMVVEQIEGRGVKDTAVLQAMRSVPRELFVPEAYKQHAYDDSPLPIPAQQTISQPYVVALMISALKLKPKARVLEIGTGSGYAAALLSRIVEEVHTVERIPELVDYARHRLQLLDYTNVTVHLADGTRGLPQYAPYDGIVVAAGGPQVPTALQAQLRVGGRLVIPVGEIERRQQLVCVMRLTEKDYEHRELGAVAFVPLIGDEGW